MGGGVYTGTFCRDMVSLKGHNTQHSGHTGQNEVMVEICSKILARAIGKVLRMKFG